MPVGSIENTSGGVLILYRLGWYFTPGWTEQVYSSSLEYEVWLQAIEELEAAVTAGDIILRDQDTNIVAAADVDAWINEVDDDALPPAKPLVTYPATFTQRVPSNGRLWLRHNTQVVHTEVGFIVPGDGKIRSMFFGCKQQDSSRTYDVQIWANPATSPSLAVSGILLTSTTNRVVQVNDLDIDLPAGEYGVRLIRQTGSGNSSFNQGMVYVIMEIR